MTGKREGTRMGHIFKNMVVDCRTQMSLYAKCVVQNSDNLEKGSCEREFQQLKECFRKVRKR